MKRISVFCLCALIILSFSACDGETTQPTVYGTVFDAVVKEVTEEGILVMPVADSREAGVAMEIGLLVIKTERIPSVKVGDKVRIDYDGVITRSIPGQLGEVYSLLVIG